MSFAVSGTVDCVRLEIVKSETVWLLLAVGLPLSVAALTVARPLLPSAVPRPDQKE